MAQRLKLRLCKVISTTLQSCTSTDTSDPPLPFSLPNSKPSAVVVDDDDFHWQKDDKWHVVCSSDGRRKNKNKNKKKKKKKKKKSRINRVSSSSSADSGWVSSEAEDAGAREAPARLSVFKKLIPCAVDGKVKESFAVVKRSEDPYEDFKNSMIDMIIEKQMFEQRDLEQLLQCFLSLNSTCYHALIVQAFSHIWDTIFNY